MKYITSVNNSYIKELSLLKNKKSRQERNRYIVEGYHLVEEAYKAGSLIQILTTNENISMDIDTILVTDAIIAKLSSTIEPQGIVGIVEMKEAKWCLHDKYLILDDISDPGNLGTIIRSSAALGIDAIIVSLDTVDIYNDKVLRATQGAIYKIPIYRRNLKEAILELKKNNISILTTSLKNSVDLTTINKPQKFAVVLGNEARGVKEEYVDLADQVIRIDMKNDVESLNVAMASGIITYYLLNK